MLPGQKITVSADCRVRILCKQHESMDLSCLVSAVQAGDRPVIVSGMFSSHTFGPLGQIECFSHKPQLTQVLLLAVSSTLTCSVTELKSSQTVFHDQ